MICCELHLVLVLLSFPRERNSERHVREQRHRVSSYFTFAPHAHSRTSTVYVRFTPDARHAPIFSMVHTGSCTVEQVQQPEQLILHPFEPQPSALGKPVLYFASEREREVELELPGNDKPEPGPSGLEPLMLDFQLELSLEIFVVDSHDTSFPGRRGHNLKREDLVFVSGDSRVLDCRLTERSQQGQAATMSLKMEI